ncbi:hypothetical protein BJV77DRAFT_1066880 [Russula vinacea]|nr:hypothetical protein BJV77DRAFT_1066880 [Russula vinacea]
MPSPTGNFRPKWRATVTRAPRASARSPSPERPDHRRVPLSETALRTPHHRLDVCAWLDDDDDASCDRAAHGPPLRAKLPVSSSRHSVFNSESGGDLTPCPLQCRGRRKGLHRPLTTHPPQLAVGATVKVLSVGRDAETPVVGISPPFSSADSLSPVSLSRAILSKRKSNVSFHEPFKTLQKRADLSEGEVGSQHPSSKGVANYGGYNVFVDAGAFLVHGG